MSKATDRFQAMINEAKSRYTWKLHTAQLNFQINIYDLRQRKGWTQQEVARRMNVKQSWIARHEAGYPPSLDSIAKYAHAFGVSMTELIDEPKFYSPYLMFNDGGEQIGSYSLSSSAVNVEHKGEWQS